MGRINCLLFCYTTRTAQKTTYSTIPRCRNNITDRIPSSNRRVHRTIDSPLIRHEPYGNKAANNTPLCVYYDSQDMLVLQSAVAYCYCKCCSTMQLQIVVLAYLPAALGSGDYSASNSNAYQKQKDNI
jgi:hypothetical protein